MSSGDGYELNPEALRQVSKGINNTISELKELGFDIDAQLGHGFDKLSLSGMEAGHPGLAETFKSFCDRWNWGVRTLMHEANELARRLDLSVGLYHEQEQYISSTLKTVVNAGMGDPTRTSDELKDMTWGEIGSDNPFNQFRDADWNPRSAESLQAHERVKDAWGQLQDDAETSTWLGRSDHDLADYKALGPVQEKPDKDGGKGGDEHGGKG
ncbi:hypothetical protein [Streptomyces sp. MST-110588]|uniref:hypothetical protein n=1 Tax=Streptomyces sp. MST-110588 TaxID=2833628 RepID=UPI001F5D6037|nr:hypothetical protein [Streptomyces sp. MST-110588]UNO41079.1 hypothetical protein KGS77_17665 [Streptomyces sp. MST-110588]